MVGSLFDNSKIQQFKDLMIVASQCIEMVLSQR